MFIEARHTMGHVDGSEIATPALDLERAYAVQRETAKVLGVRVGGYKIGCSTLAQQKMFDVREPFYGPVFENDIYASPAKLDASKLHVLGIECELMFRLGRDLDPARPREDAASYVEALVPGFEVFASRLNQPLAFGLPALVADCGGNGALVQGADFKDWKTVDLAHATVTLWQGDKVISEGSGGVVLGNPYHSLEWFLKTCHALGQPLEAGQIIACGSMTPVYFANPGEQLVADFGRLGRVELQL